MDAKPHNLYAHLLRIMHKLCEACPILTMEAISNDNKIKECHMHSLLSYNILMRFLMLAYSIASIDPMEITVVRLFQTASSAIMMINLSTVKSKKSTLKVLVIGMLLIYLSDLEICVRFKPSYVFTIMLHFPIFCLIGVTFFESMKIFHKFILYLNLHHFVRLYFQYGFSKSMLELFVQILITHLSVSYTTYMFLTEKKSRMDRSKEAIDNLECWKLTMNMCPIGFLVKQENDVAYANSEMSHVLSEYDVGKSMPYLKSLELFAKRFKATILGDTTIRRINIDTKIIEWKSKPIMYKSTPADIHIFIDVTSSSNIEKSIVQKKYIEMLIATSTHELRTPLNGIKSILSLSKELIGKQNQYLIEKALSACELQENLINDIMDFAKIQDDKIKITKEIFNVKELLQYCYNIIEYQASIKGLTLLMKLSQNTPEYWNSDQRRIKQIILNLLSNSLKFTQKGTIKIKCKTKQQYLYFQVIDTGIGIKDDDKEKLFKPFGILDSTRSINKNGTGLGLNLCKTLCHYLGGDIKVKSKFEVGSKFTFFINSDKLSQESIEKMSISMQSNAKPTISKSNKKILVVDDIPLNVQVATNMLLRLGMPTYKAFSGNDAITIVKQSKDISAALIDLNMPILDGYELCSILKMEMRNGNVDEFPLIALTGEERDDVLDACITKGFADVITKPLSLDEIKRRLKNFT